MFNSVQSGNQKYRTGDTGATGPTVTSIVFNSGITIGNSADSFPGFGFPLSQDVTFTDLSGAFQIAADGPTNADVTVLSTLYREGVQLGPVFILGTIPAGSLAGFKVSNSYTGLSLLLPADNNFLYKVSLSSSGQAPVTLKGYFNGSLVLSF